MEHKILEILKAVQCDDITKKVAVQKILDMFAESGLNLPEDYNPSYDDIKNYIWNDSKVIDFVNWYIQFHNLPFNYELENLALLEEFKHGTIAERDDTKNPLQIYINWVINDDYYIEAYNSYANNILLDFIIRKLENDYELTYHLNKYPKAIYYRSTLEKCMVYAHKLLNGIEDEN